MIPGPLWTRDGHLLDLALHLHHIGDLSGETGEAVRAHLSECAHCQQRLFQLTALASAPLPPLSLTPEPEPEPEPLPEPIPLRPRRRWSMLAGGLALAAGLLLVARIILPGPDTYQSRGDGLGLSVYRKDAAGVSQLSEGDTLRPGDELSFTITTKRPGYLMLVGVDGTTKPYRISPPTGDPPALDASPEATQLDSGVRIDATPGAETLTAIHCEQPMSWDEGVAMRTGTSRKDCVTASIRLEKQIP